MNKYIVQCFIILIIILLGVSLISESNDKLETKKSISSFEESVSNNKEVDNGSMEVVTVIEEDSSNLISDVNSKIASFVVGGLNKIFNLGIKLIEGVTN